MKYSVSIYSFNQKISSGELTVEDCIAKTAEMGFDAIEFTDSVFVGKENKNEYAEYLKRKCKSVGLEISNFAVSADLLNGGDETISKLKEFADLAHIMGCPTLRHDVAGGAPEGSQCGYEGIVSILAERCREVTEYAKTLGVKTMTENHGFFSQDSLRVEKLINTVNNSNFGMLVDMGNFLCADDDPATAVGRCAPYAFYVHAKDFIVKSGTGPNPGEGFFMSRAGNFLRGTILGHGDVPVIQCIRALKRVNYDGYISLEFEGMEDCVNGITIGFDNLKKYVASA